MTNLEFQEILKTLDIKECLFIPNGGKMNKDFDDIYFKDGIALSFDGKSLVEINGFIPLEIAETIYQNYPLSTMTKRIFGNEDIFSSDPSRVKSKGNYEQKIQLLINKKYAIALPEQRKDIVKYLLKDNINNNDDYITRYFICDKEDLLIFLLEMQDYINKKNNLPKTASLKYDELLEQINHNLVVKIGADKTTSDRISSYKYVNTVQIDDKIKCALDRFDKTVNPFMDTDLQLTSFKEMFNNVSISIGNFFNKICTNNYELIISDLSSRCSYTAMERGLNYYAYKLSNIEDESNYFMVEHICLPIQDGNKQRFNEKIVIRDSLVYLEYDLNNQMIKHSYKEKDFIKPQEKEYIYSQLLKAIEVASIITINNMTNINEQDMSFKKKKQQ